MRRWGWITVRMAAAGVVSRGLRSFAVFTNELGKDPRQLHGQEADDFLAKYESKRASWLAEHQAIHQAGEGSASGDGVTHLAVAAAGDVEEDVDALLRGGQKRRSREERRAARAVLQREHDASITASAEVEHVIPGTRFNDRRSWRASRLASRKAVDRNDAPLKIVDDEEHQQRIALAVQLLRQEEEAARRRFATKGWSERDVKRAFGAVAQFKKRSPQRRGAGERRAHKLRLAIAEEAESRPSDDSAMSTTGKHEDTNIAHAKQAREHRVLKMDRLARRMLEARARADRVRRAVKGAGLALPEERFCSEFHMKCLFKAEDVVEASVRGQGPGGQATNRRRQSCLLHHIPTDIVVRSHKFPSLYMNRKLARRQLSLKLEYFFLGPLSVIGQRKAAQERQRIKRARQSAKQHRRRSESKVVLGDQVEAGVWVREGIRYTDFLLQRSAEAVRADAVKDKPLVRLPGDNSATRPREAFPYLPLAALACGVSASTTAAGRLEFPAPLHELAAGSPAEDILRRAHEATKRLSARVEHAEEIGSALPAVPSAALSAEEKRVLVSVERMREEPIRREWLSLLEAGWRRQPSATGSDDLPTGQEFVEPPLWFCLLFPAVPLLPTDAGELNHAAWSKSPYVPNEWEIREASALSSPGVRSDVRREVALNLNALLEGIGVAMISSENAEVPKPPAGQTDATDTTGRKKKTKKGKKRKSATSTGALAAQQPPRLVLHVTEPQTWAENSVRLVNGGVLDGFARVDRCLATMHGCRPMLRALRVFFEGKASAENVTAANPAIRRRQELTREACGAVLSALRD